MTTQNAPAQGTEISIIGSHSGRSWHIKNKGVAKDLYTAYSSNTSIDGNFPELYVPKYTYHESFPHKQVYYDMDIHSNWQKFCQALEELDRKIADILVGAGIQVPCMARDRIVVDNRKPISGSGNVEPYKPSQKQTPTKEEIAFMKRHNLHKTDLGYDDDSFEEWL